MSTRTECKDRDTILRIINEKKQVPIEEKVLDIPEYEEQLLILFEEGYIEKTRIPIHLRLTPLGFAFLENGGYLKQKRIKKLDRFSNLSYLIATPIFALMSLVVSSLALYFSTRTADTNSNQPLNFQSEIKVSFPEKTDTIYIYKEKLPPKKGK